MAINRTHKTIAQHNQAVAVALALRIAQQVQRGSGKGLNAARVFLTARSKEAVSVPAPRKRVISSAGNIYYRATTKATKGAAPRKLSGKLRQSITSAMVGPTKAVLGANARSMPTARYPRGFAYPRHLELSGQHPFFAPTAVKWKKQLAQIVGRAIKVEVS